MFVGSGVFRHKSDVSSWEICLKCGGIEFEHYQNAGKCTYNDWQLEYRNFDKGNLEFKDFEHFHFKRWQYLSRRKIKCL